MRVIVSATSNWNVDPVIEGLTRIGCQVTLFCLRRRSRISKEVKSVVRPPISFALQSFLYLLGKIGFGVGEMYSSRLSLLVFVIFDYEVSLYARLLGRFDLFVGWASCATRSISVVKKQGIPAMLYLGNSHIKTQSQVQRDIGGIEVRDGYIHRQVLEYALCDLLLVESEYSKATLVAGGVPADKVRVVDVPCDIRKPDAVHIPGSIDGSRNRKEACGQRTGEAPLRIAYVSPRLIKGKKVFEDLVQLCVERREHRWRFSVFGGTSEDVRHFSGTPTVTVCQGLPKANFLEVFSECDVLLVPTYEDGGPRVASEALCLGLTVLGAPNSKIPEFSALGLAEVVPENTAGAYYARLETFSAGDLRNGRDRIANTSRDYLSHEKFDKQLHEALQGLVIGQGAAQ